MAYAHDQQISSTIPQDFQWARDMMLANRGDASTNVEAIRAAVEKFGPAPGAKKMLEWEREAAELAIKTGVYTVWRNIETKQECTRVGPNSRCFCGHLHKSHAEGGGQCNGPKDTACACKYFEFIPRRPEEVGEWWLPRRKGFDVTQWRAKCRCKHSHSDHMGGANIMRRCTAPDCGCSCFQSDFLCVVCDRHWEDHETHQEGAGERRAAGRPTGAAFFPLSDNPAIQKLVFGAELSDQWSLEARGAPFEHASEEMQLAAMKGSWEAQDARLRRPNPMDKPERSVKLSATNAGGRAAVKTDRRFRIGEGEEGFRVSGGAGAGGMALLEGGVAGLSIQGAGGLGGGVGGGVHSATFSEGRPLAHGGSGAASSSRSFSEARPNYCTECGEPLREGAKFCGQCGVRV